MDVSAASLTLILLLAGFCHCQLPGSDRSSILARPCRMEDILKCMTDAVKSYVRTTQGEEAAKLPAGPVITQKVMGAISADMTSPLFDINSTCEVLMDMDIQGYADCMVRLGEKCDMSSDKRILAEEGIRAIPPLRIGGFAQLAQRIDTMCLSECIYLDLPGLIKKIEGYWDVAEYALDRFNYGNENFTVSSKECRDVRTYIEMQWELSLPCEMLTSLMKSYHKLMADLISMCQVTLPPEALELLEPIETISAGKDKLITSIYPTLLLATIIIKLQFEHAGAVL